MAGRAPVDPRRPGARREPDPVARGRPRRRPRPDARHAAALRFRVARRRRPPAGAVEPGVPGRHHHPARLRRRVRPGGGERRAARCRRHGLGSPRARVPARRLAVPRGPRVDQRHLRERPAARGRAPAAPRATSSPSAPPSWSTRSPHDARRRRVRRRHAHRDDAPDERGFPSGAAAAVRDRRRHGRRPRRRGRLRARRLHVRGAGRHDGPAGGAAAHHHRRGQHAASTTRRSATPRRPAWGRRSRPRWWRTRRVSFGHVGDSRAYLWRDGVLQQVSDDHSLVGELVRRGALTPEEAERHPQKNIITRTVGTEPALAVDTWTLEAAEDDVFLLASDGLNDMIRDAEIARDPRLGAVPRARRPRAGARRQRRRRHRQHHGAAVPRRRRPARRRPPSCRPRRRCCPTWCTRTSRPEAPPTGLRRLLFVLSALVVAGALGARRRWPCCARRTSSAPRPMGGVAIYQGVPYDLVGDLRLYRRIRSSPIPVSTLTPAERAALFDHELLSLDDAQAAHRPPAAPPSTTGATRDRAPPHAAQPRARQPARRRPDGRDGLRRRLHRARERRLDRVAVLRRVLHRPLRRRPRRAAHRAAARPTRTCCRWWRCWRRSARSRSTASTPTLARDQGLWIIVGLIVFSIVVFTFRDIRKLEGCATRAARRRCCC